MKSLKIMSVMAHQDDFEFNAGGMFALLRGKFGNNLKIKILCTTTGASGHHAMGLEETFRRREREAKNSAIAIDADYECLTCLDGKHLAGQVFIDRNFLGGLWNAIRDFEPDYVFCPPVVTDPLAGIHIDHYHTAWAVRLTAYHLTVPHAYPVMNGSSKMRVPYPVIINVDDPYSGEGHGDLAVDISEVYEDKVKMALCHESQIYEWLPWNSGEEQPITEPEFKRRFRQRHSSVNQRYGRDDAAPREYFRLTQWGKTANLSEVKKLLDIP